MELGFYRTPLSRRTRSARLPALLLGATLALCVTVPVWAARPDGEAPAPAEGGSVTLHQALPQLVARAVGRNPLSEFDLLPAEQVPPPPAAESSTTAVNDSEVMPAESPGHAAEALNTLFPLPALLAMGMLDVPYVRGGTSTSGVDCSGLVAYAFRQAGLQVPRTVREMFTRVTPVALDDLLPGDLVFFKVRNNTVSHVGIYIAAGRFIHAPRTGKFVTFANLNNPYWKKRIVSGGRVLGAVRDQLMPW
ncbi:MAG: C40 family peptidase [Gammaproteobacteria bacterium]|nr:C40 family peptidase [Gammaproteobacteria bacterium]